MKTNRDRSRASGKRMRHRFLLFNPTTRRGTQNCFAPFRRVRFATVHHLTFLLQRIVCPLRMYCCRRQRPIGAVQASRALRKRRPPRSARHQTTRCRSKCAGSLCATPRCKKHPCDGASAAGAIHASTSAAKGELSSIPLRRAVATWIFPACRSRGKARPKISLKSDRPFRGRGLIIIGETLAGRQGD